MIEECHRLKIVRYFYILNLIEKTLAYTCLKPSYAANQFNSPAVTRHLNLSVIVYSPNIFTGPLNLLY